LTGRTLGEALDDIISESLAGVMQQRTQKEQGRQQALAGAMGPVDELEEDDSGDSEGGDEPSDDDKDDKGESPEKEKRAPEAKDVVDKLNAFRSGRSFRDDEVKSSFNNYFEKLSDAEKVALYTFAKGIAQIVTGEVPSNAAAEPGDHPADVQMTRSGPQKKHLDPNVIKKAEPSKQQGKPTSQKGEEDTTPPSPIKAK
jgi:hypothetical protein